MLKTYQNTIGNLMIALLFVGGCIFLLTGSWDASETEAATGCCGGGEPTLVAETTGCCGGGTNKAPRAAGNADCDCIAGKAGHGENAKCGLCAANDCGNETDGKVCGSDCTADPECGPEGTKCNEEEVFCENSDNRHFCQGNSEGCPN